MQPEGIRKRNRISNNLVASKRVVLAFLLSYILSACNAVPLALPAQPSMTAIPSVQATASFQSLATATTTNTRSNSLPLTPTVTKPAPSPTINTEPVFPIRAAFFYPWFPEAWNQQGFDPFSNYQPSAGYYDSGSTSTIEEQIAAMTYANIQAGILSWWGQNSPTDQRVATILAATRQSVNPYFQWTLYYEPEGQGDPTVNQIQNDLTYIREHYANDQNFLHVDGKFVIFVYNDPNDRCSMADRWVQANANLGEAAYVSLKIFPGYRSCGSQPDSWHQYAPAVAVNNVKGLSFTISPGFWLTGQETPRLARNPDEWATNIQAMVSSGAPWQLITTFNEWGEGTAIEVAQQWTSPSGYGIYLDALHNILTINDK